MNSVKSGAPLRSKHLMPGVVQLYEAILIHLKALLVFSCDVVLLCYSMKHFMPELKQPLHSNLSSS